MLFPILVAALTQLTCVQAGFSEPTTVQLTFGDGNALTGFTYYNTFGGTSVPGKTMDKINTYVPVQFPLGTYTGTDSADGLTIVIAVDHEGTGAGSYTGTMTTIQHAGPIETVAALCQLTPN